MAAGSHEEWIPLVEFLLDNPRATPAFVKALWDVQPDTKKWLGNIEQALANTEKVSTVSSGKKILLPWLLNSVLGAFPSTHEAALEMRIQDLRSMARDDGGFADGKALFADLIKYQASDKRLAAVALLVAKGAFTEGNYKAARDYSTKAIGFHSNAGNARGADLAKRYLGGPLLHLHQWDKAFALFDEVLVARGPLFGGGGVTVFRSYSDPKEEAIGEAQAIALWASHSVPEWVRAIGGLTEVFANDSYADALNRRYKAGLTRLMTANDPLDELEVVIRQLRERSFNRAAFVAAQVGADSYPKNSWIHSVAGNISRELGDHKAAYKHYRISAKLLDAAKSEDAGEAWMNAGDAAATLGDSKAAQSALMRAAALAKTDGARREVDFYVARSLRKKNPKAAREKAQVLFKELSKDARQLAESKIGPPTVDLLVDLLLAEKNREALVVQKKLLDAKHELWGEVPSVWLERHNLGTIHAQFGEPAEGKRLIESAMAKLIETFGENHEHVKMCRRSLARISSQ